MQEGQQQCDVLYTSLPWGQQLQLKPIRRRSPKQDALIQIAINQLKARSKMDKRDCKRACGQCQCGALECKVQYCSHGSRAPRPHARLAIKQRRVPRARLPRYRWHWQAWKRMGGLTCKQASTGKSLSATRATTQSTNKPVAFERMHMPVRIRRIGKNFATQTTTAAA